MKNEIIPSIVSRDLKDLEKKIKIVDGLANWIEVDVADGIFADNITFQDPKILEEIDGKIKISAHLMIELPETVIEDWLAVVDRVVVHYESTEDLLALLEKYGGKIQEVVVALGLDTPLNVIDSFFDQIKTIQLMSIQRLGFQGENFCPKVIDRIMEIKSRWPKLSVIVDGGIGLNEAPDLLVVGADGLVVGSAIWSAPDPQKALIDLQNLRKSE